MAANFEIGGLRTRKQYFLGAHRSCSPEETWDRIMPLFPRFGITRVADITGLDRIGIPVAVAIRPLSRSVAVSAGKGTDLLAAKVSAAMEGIECAHAEGIGKQLILASREELVQDQQVLEINALPVMVGSDVNDRTRLLWIAGRNLSDNSFVMVPYGLVHAHFAPPRFPGSEAFVSTTNGLASGNTPVEAICHGLFEVIERDALNLWSRLPMARRNKKLVNVESATHPVVRDAIDRLVAKGFGIAVWDITSDVGIAAFHCIIADLEESDGHPGAGSGCHTDKNVALARALFEAIQVRATYISGGRDDLSRREYEIGHMNFFRRVVETAHGYPGASRQFADIPSVVTEHFEDDLDRTIDCLGLAGLDPVVVVDFSQAGTGIAVVRVIVPGLEPPLGSNARSGERANRIQG